MAEALQSMVFPIGLYMNFDSNIWFKPKIIYNNASRLEKAIRY